MKCKEKCLTFQCLIFILHLHSFVFRRERERERARKLVHVHTLADRAQFIVAPILLQVYQMVAQVNSTDESICFPSYLMALTLFATTFLSFYMHSSAV